MLKKECGEWHISALFFSVNGFLQFNQPATASQKIRGLSRGLQNKTAEIQTKMCLKPGIHRIISTVSWSCRQYFPRFQGYASAGISNYLPEFLWGIIPPGLKHRGNKKTNNNNNNNNNNDNLDNMTTTTPLLPTFSK
jgi:hypothetical protein